MDTKTRTSLVWTSLGLFLVLCGSLWLLSSPGRRLHEFFFNRSFVQFVTLYVFSLLVVLLAHRGLRCYREFRALDAAKKGDEGSRSQPCILSELHEMMQGALLEQGSQAIPKALRNGLEGQKEKIRSGQIGRAHV